MSTLNTTNIKNPSSASNNIVLDASGNVVLQAGSAASPALQPTGDTNTGIYSPGADTLAVSTGGSERLRVDSSGRLGVGITSPFFTADIAGAAECRHRFTGAAAGFLFGQFNSSGDASLNNSANAPLLLGTNNTERLRITNAGLIQHALNSIVTYAHSTASPATVTLPAHHAQWELSIYAARNSGGGYGTRYQVYHIGALGGYPRSQWSAGTALVSDIGVGQTSTAPGISISSAVNGVITITVTGTGVVGWSYSLRQLNIGFDY